MEDVVIVRKNNPTATYSWRDVFDCSKKYQGFIAVGHAKADAAGYPFFLWNDRVYVTETMQDTGHTIANIK